MKLISEITTKRLHIRPFQMSDLNPFISFMLDEESTKHLMFTKEQKTMDGAIQLFDYVIGSYATDSPLNSLAIALPNGIYIGSCGASPIEEGKVYECYYSINEEFRGNGYATEATMALIAYILDYYPDSEIRAYMSPENPYSAAVAENCGMENMGIALHPVFGNKGLLYTIKL